MLKTKLLVEPKMDKPIKKSEGRKVADRIVKEKFERTVKKGVPAANKALNKYKERKEERAERIGHTNNKHGM